MKRSTRKNRGAVLVIVLCVLAGLVAILAAAASNQHVWMKSQGNRIEQQRAEIAAEAAVQRALAVLSSQSSTSTTTSDDWYSLGDNGSDRFILNDVQFRMQIVDAASLININTATESTLDYLPLTQEQIDCLLDWRESGTTARDNGAKDDYYNSLTYPYNAKLKKLNSIDELLLIKNFTAPDVYEPSTVTPLSGSSVASVSRTNSNGLGTSTTSAALADLITVDSVSSDGSTTKLNVNTASVTAQQISQQAGVSMNVANAIVARRQRSSFTSIGDVLSVNGVTLSNAAGILNNLTTSSTTTGTGLINLNTVGQAVLSTLSVIPSDVANNIISQQSSTFTALGDLASVSGMSITVLQQVASLFCVNSQQFLVRCEGTCGSTHVYLEALVSIESGTPKVLKYRHPSFSDMPTRWAWQDQASTDIVLMEAQS